MLIEEIVVRVDNVGLDLVVRWAGDRGRERTARGGIV